MDPENTCGKTGKSAAAGLLCPPKPHSHNSSVVMHHLLMAWSMLINPLRRANPAISRRRGVHLMPMVGSMFGVINSPFRSRTIG